MPNSHRQAGPDITVLFVSCLSRRCELDSRRIETVANRKFKVWSRSQQSSNSHQHTRHDTDRTVLSCRRAVWTESARPPDKCIQRRSVAAQALPVRPLDALRRRTRMSGARADSVHTAWHDTDSTVLSCLAGGVNWALVHIIERQQLSVQLSLQHLQWSMCGSEIFKVQSFGHIPGWKYPCLWSCPN